jgi:hypothetical protein
MHANYFFIDGSALTAQIRQLQRAEPIFRARKLCPQLFLQHFMYTLRDLHAGEYKRATFYFPKGDETAIEDFLHMPDHKKPGSIRDLNFKFCGHKLKKSVEFDKFVEESVPSKFHDRFAKSEKGIDIEMCCDALRLASSSRIERLFLLSNDGDFIPFCRILKEFGANISILHLSEATLPNGDLLREADSYDIIPKNVLNSLFLPIPTTTEPQEIDLGETAGGGLEAGEVFSEKPETAPSDLKIIDEDSEDSAVPPEKQ